MKINLLLLLSFVLTFHQKIKAQAPPEILHYNFNGTGTLIPNMASNPPAGTANATIVGTQSLGATGQCGGALIGDGTATSYVNTNWAPNLSGSWTLSFWTSSITPSATLWYILGDVNTSSLRCFTNGAAGANNWLLRGGGLTDITVSGGATMNPNLNTIVCDAVAGVTTAYLNGVFNASVTQAPVTVSGTGPLRIGHYNASTGLPAGGLMDEVRLYSRALTPAEVTGLMNVVSTASVYTQTSCGSYTSVGNNVYTSSGTYTESVLSCGTPITNTLNLTINAPLTLTLAANSLTICNGQSVNLTASGSATSYSWSTGSTSPSSQVAPSTNTTYVVTAYLTSCALSRTINVAVKPAPSVTLVSTTNTICLGSSVSFTASGASSYSWNPVTASAATLTDSPATTMTYSVTGTNTVGCSNTKTLQVTVNTFTPGISPSTSICAGQEATLTASGAVSYTWSTLSPFSSVNVKPSATSVYTVTATDYNYCIGTNSVTVAVNQNPTLTVDPQSVVMCKGQTTTISAQGAATYSWSDGSTNAGLVFTPNTTLPTHFIVTGKNAAGCSDSKTVNITVSPCTGISAQNIENAVSIFPNPSRGLITVTLNSDYKNVSLKIYNAMGDLVKIQAISGKANLDISDLPNGIYTLSLLENTGIIHSAKIVKE